MTQFACQWTGLQDNQQTPQMSIHDTEEAAEAEALQHVKTGRRAVVFELHDEETP